MTWAAALRLAPYVVAGVLALLLQSTRAELATTRLEAKVDVAHAERDLAQKEAAGATRMAQAADAYAVRTASVQPLIVRSTDTVTRYAETPAGRAVCAAPDRVHGIDQLDADLFAPAAAARGARAVQANAGAATD